MSRILIHMACPYNKRAVANAIAGLSGRNDEHSFPLKSSPGKPAAIWDGIKGYPQGRWLGASSYFAPAILQNMLADAYVKKPESYFVAYWEDSGEPVQGGTNCPVWPEDNTWDAFLAVLGLVPDETEY